MGLFIASLWYISELSSFFLNLGNEEQHMCELCESAAKNPRDYTFKVQKQCGNKSNQRSLTTHPTVRADRDTLQDSQRSSLIQTQQHQADLFIEQSICQVVGVTALLQTQEFWNFYSDVQTIKLSCVCTQIPFTHNPTKRRHSHSWTEWHVVRPKFSKAAKRFSRHSSNSAILNSGQPFLLISHSCAVTRVAWPSLIHHGIILMLALNCTSTLMASMPATNKMSRIPKTHSQMHKIDTHQCICFRG